LDRKERHLVNKLDKSSFEELFRTYFTPLCAFAQKYVGDADEAKDIIHQVFIGLWQKREDVDLSTSLKSYLFTGVHNRCLNYIRDRKKIIQFDAPQHESELGNYLESRDFLEASETEAKINAALDDLPEKCRQIFMMNRFDQLKYREIADKLNISIKTVETQMSRALKMLREKLSDLITILILYFLNSL
jgi:RNA polymerase sigma-70 factor (ECF subfamily)